MLPKEIKIGAVTWPIIVKKMKDCGQCQKADFEIWINQDLSEQGKESTLIHEIIHAVYTAAGVNDEEQLKEEQVVSRLEYMLYSTLRENGFWPSSQKSLS